MKSNLIKYLCFVLVFCISCFGYKTNDGLKAYEYWANEKPPKDVQVLNGKYWQSPHFTKEYEMYLELIAPDKWREDYIKLNNLVQHKNLKVDDIPDDKPKWFKPPITDRIWKPSDTHNHSITFEDTITNRFFIYEIQL